MRGINKSTYNFHIHGTLCGHSIDQKYTCISQFLEEYGGDKTELKLNRTKLYRIRQRWTGNEKNTPPKYKTNEYNFMKKNWHLHIDVINEPRKKKVTKQVVYFD